MSKDKSAPPKKENSGSLSILVAEADSELRDSVIDFLNRHNYHAVAQADGAKALAAITKEHFDLAIISLEISSKNGIEVLAEAIEKWPDAKIVITSAHPTADSIARCIKLGAIDYLTVPYTNEELGRVIDDAVGSKKFQETGQLTASKPGEKQQEITSMMEEKRVFNPPQDFVDKAAVSGMRHYKALYNWSIKDPEGFWGHLAEQLDWYKKWDKVREYSFRGNIAIKYFIGGKLNISYNCLDRHLSTWRKNKAALIWQGEDEDEVRTFTYQQVHYEVCKFANVLKKHGVKKGDAVTIYMPMIPEATFAMLACTRIGAIHSAVFSGFSGESLRDRILDCNSKLLITADGYHRNGQIIRCKDAADIAIKDCPDVKDVIIVKRLGLRITINEDRDRWWHEEMEADDISPVCEPAVMDAEDPLFILYTSGSTGKPKGVLHTQAGYLMHCFQTMKWVFDIKDEDLFWCTADIGWVTGHSYVVYGPLATGATSFIYEGTPTYPKPDRIWQIVEKFKVNTFYTAPTLIRALMRDGEEWPKKHDLSSLRLLGTVGEPINPEAWMWYHRVIGREKCPIADTWWQTETGGHLIAPLPGAMPTKPGSATMPLPGVELAIVNADGNEVDINEGGYLCVKEPWPGIMRTIYGDHEKFKNTYFFRFPGMYFSGDGARKDEDGYYWIMGRIDDVLNVSGHRIGTAEVESALVSNPRVAEAAVVGIHHAIKGQGIYAFVTLKRGEKPGKATEKELRDHVRKVIGPIASPDKIQFAEGLPKTRSGKIMRRILVKIANGDISNLGDITTLADPSVVETLVNERV
ncbi:MAG: acetate--CoA ligase [Dehalococcoidales bacterium]|nr:acetate--CoA ligase [Dehalococcoidales bacterium]